MKIIDSHFHWWPRPVFERLCKRKGYPRAEVNDRGGYAYWRKPGGVTALNSWAEWFDLDDQLAHMDSLGHEIGAVCSIGPYSVHFSDLPVDEGRDAALEWNEEMAGAQAALQRRHSVPQGTAIPGEPPFATRGHIAAAS